VTLTPFAQPVRLAADLTDVTFVRVALLLALAALSTAVATGCAADSSAPATANVRSPVGPPPVSPFVTIDSPGDRAVAARQDPVGIRAMADVAGRGNAGDLVQVSTGCDDPRCAAGTQVDPTGHWSVRVLLKATKSYPRVRVVAQTGAQVAISLARLDAPTAKTASRRHARTHTARRAASSTTRPAATSASATTSTPAAPTSTSSSSSNLAPSRMVVVGDSLAEGVRSPLTNALSGWTLSTNARVGRPLAEGMGIVRGMSERPPVLAISLFTNDAPGAVDALRSAVRETITRQSGHGCVVWATIVRPAVGGVTYARANQALAELAAENPSVMKLVPWAQQVAAHPEWLGSDGVHATPAGYSARAQMFAEAARSCA
jgi:hypothetical protein